jgi:maltooligosyltrehalose trehalohydrolase
MTALTVWAPNANKVEVEAGKACHRLTAGDDGWWSTELSISESGAEYDYMFRLDGGQPLPDPRSPWQPIGIDGPSRLIDHTTFPWTDGRWQAPPLSAATIYERHIGTFTSEGTFIAAIDKLDYLVDLGISHVELMPVAEFSGSRGWSYDGVELYAPHNAYGGPEGLKRLVDACHGRGLAVVLDVVYNHLARPGTTSLTSDHISPIFTLRRGDRQ